PRWPEGIRRSPQTGCASWRVLPRYNARQLSRRFRPHAVRVASAGRGGVSFPPSSRRSSAPSSLRERKDEMKRLLFLALAIGLAAAPSRADDVVLTIAPEAGFSSDHVTLCRVTARNFTGHSIDGRSVAFEAQAWENGVAVMTEHGRFGGRIG